MKHLFFTLFISLLTGQIFGQSSITGSIIDGQSQTIIQAPVFLKLAKDSSLVKGAVSDDAGSFKFEGIADGSYFVEISYLGMKDYRSEIFNVANESITKLNTITMTENSEVMQEVQVSATRSILEVKADRTVFNVQGTINASGQSGVNLLRKAPGILVDNNNNISVLGRSGVLVYVDGKRLPLSGDDLTNYLNSLTSEQIDRIEIITNPGAKYEAQGNAGIIDIRLKKDENLGSNATISTNISHGRYPGGNANLTANHRTKSFNTFGNIGGYAARNWNFMEFLNFQSGIRTDEKNTFINDNSGYNARWGTDFFINKHHTIGFLVSGGINDSKFTGENKSIIYPSAVSNVIDSVLVANNTGDNSSNQGTANINYAFEKEKNKVNIDLDYGLYINKNEQNQPNQYFNEDLTTLRSQNLNAYDTPRDIIIGTAKIDYETSVGKAALSFGTKYSQVNTENTFLFYNVINNNKIRNDRRSNEFTYDEKVYAAYANYASQINQKWNISAGLRAEYTDAQGDLDAFVQDLEEEPVDFEYLSWFPSAGLSYNHAPEHNWALNYGRRINRPNYNVLNPFREQISELSYSKGNERLQPEKVHNLELGYTFKYMYNIKLAYSRTDNQITRLIGPDDLDPRAGFISWDNLATQDIFSFNASLPFTINKWWSLYVNASANYTNNQADYGDGGKVDVQAGSYSLYQQSTFTLGGGYTGEISGYYAGPGVWGGVFLYDPSYSLDFGLQKKFFKDKFNVRISFSDVTYQSFWSGYSEFNGLRGEGKGGWDSRRASLSLSYDLGNKKVNSRKRKTGIEDESKRVGG